MFWSFSFAPCFQRTHRCKKYTGFSQCLNVKIPFGPSSLERASHFSNRLTYIIAIHLRFLDFKIDVCCLNAVQLSSVSFRPSADYVVCLLCSIGDAVALILCPRGTADMDESKLLTWCCLLCSPIDQRRCSPPVSQPAFQYAASVQRHPPSLFHPSCWPLFSLSWIDMCKGNKAAIYDFTH